MHWGTTNPAIPFTRSASASGTGVGTGNPKAARNMRTGWLDGSSLYGSDDSTAATLWNETTGEMFVDVVSRQWSFFGYKME